jgi:hypothetical protein
MQSKTFYEILGVKQTASEQEIKSAYRHLAKKHHPDLHSNNPQAEEQFKLIAAAYEALSDPYARSRYDYSLFWVESSNTDLARRVVACKGFRWLLGMKANGMRVIALDPKTGTPFGLPNPLPNLNDPVTGLSLLLLIREAWRESLLSTAWDEQGWYILTPYGVPLFGKDRWATEVEALVHALEIADEHFDDLSNEEDDEEPLALT